jgi:hypothetical protein
MGKGGSSTSVQIPQYIEDAAKRNLNRADKISALGSVPLSFGPTAAAFTPAQQSVFTNTADQALSFGLSAPSGNNVMGGMDAPTTYANGVSAYSGYPIYEQIESEFAQKRPGQKDYIDSFFIDPYTGAAGYNIGNPIDYSNYGYTAAPDSGTNISIDNSSSFDGGSNPVTIDSGYTVPSVYIDNTIVDDLGNSAPFNEVDQYDDEGDNNFLTEDETNDLVNVIQNETGFDDYDPNTDVIAGTQYEDAYTNSDAAQEAADTLYNNNQVIYGPDTGNNVTSLTTGGDNWSGAVDANGNSISMEDQINAQADAYADTGVEFDMNNPDTWISAEQAYNQPDQVVYDGSSEKNSQVASILKDQYGWSDQQLIDGGYEGYAPEPEPTFTDTVTDIISASPTVQIVDSILNPDVTTDADLFNDTYTAASVDAANNPTGVTQPAVYNDNDNDNMIEFANTVENSDDITTFLPPSNDNDDGPQGIVGNNDTGQNSAAQALANTLTPNDGMEYVDGVLVNTGATVNAMNNDNDDSNDTGNDKIVCTEMYRQTQLDDWVMAMKTWYVYQRKHLTPYHQVGYHAVFRPFVKGMRRSTIITNIGAYAATERTKHLRHVLTKGKSEDSLFGRILCKVMEPPLYVVGRVVSAIRKDA